MITSLKPNQIIVVGTNGNGNHWGGAAAQAHRDFGLQWGVSEGCTGQSYAFPTLNMKMEKRTKKQLRSSAKRLFNYCRGNTDKEFVLTAVGTGIAGFSHEEMKAIFINPPKNLILPEEWK